MLTILTLAQAALISPGAAWRCRDDGSGQGVCGGAEQEGQDAWLPTAPDRSDLCFDLALLDEAPPALLRGPYLQRVGADRATLRWRTALPEESRVWWGDAPTALLHLVADPAPVLEHEVEISGLLPSAEIFYAVGGAAGPLAGGDALHRFRTQPAPAAPRPLRFWLLGDGGTGGAAQAAVRDGFLAWAGARPLDLALLLGDNAYSAGRDAEYQSNFFTPYAAQWITIPPWPARGNHDSLTAVYEGVFTMPSAGECGGTPSGTEAWYSFDAGAAHLVVLDSAYSDLRPGAPMLAWLAADLAATDRLWRIAILHHPPYTRGSHDSDDPHDSGGRLFMVRESLTPLLEAGGVDLVISGHSHSYERSTLIRGHLGLSSTFGPQHQVDPGDGRESGDGPYAKLAGPDAGTVYVVAGSAGKFEAGTWDHPALPFHHPGLGSFALDLDGGRLDAVFVDEHGVERDRFTILKRRRPLLSSSSLHAGQPLTLRLADCAAAAAVALAASIRGAGPWSTPYGEAALTPPVAEIARGAADAEGGFAFTATLPPGLAGRSVWFQGLEFTGPGSGLFSNGVGGAVP